MCPIMPNNLTMKLALAATVLYVGALVYAQISACDQHHIRLGNAVRADEVKLREYLFANAFRSLLILGRESIPSGPFAEHEPDWPTGNKPVDICLQNGVVLKNAVTKKGNEWKLTGMIENERAEASAAPYVCQATVYFSKSQGVYAAEMIMTRKNARSAGP